MISQRMRLQQIYRELNHRTGELPRIIQRAIVSYGRDGGSSQAAAIAYYALLSFFPLTLLLLSIGSSLLIEAQDQVVNFVEGFLPTAGDLVRYNVTSVMETRGAIGGLAVLGLLWSASSVFAAIDRAVNRAWGATTLRSFWRQKALALAIVIAVGLLFVISALMTTAYNLLTSLSTPWLDIEQLGNHLGRRWLTLLWPMLLDYFVFLILYRLLPVIHVRWRDALPGAVVAATAWQIAKAGFNLYLRNFASYNLVYGSVTTIIVFMAFTYIAAVILIMGAEFSSAWTSLRRERNHPPMWNEKDLARWIAENEVAAEVICLPVETPTVQAAAAAVNAPPEAIIKSLIFLADGRPHLVIANGPNRVERGKLSAHWRVSKKRIKMASPEKVLELTGYPVGTVPPFGHRTPLPALMDPAVMEQDVVYAGGGGREALLRLRPQELLRVLEPELVSVLSDQGRGS